MGHNELRSVPDIVAPLLSELRLNSNKISVLPVCVCVGVCVCGILNVCQCLVESAELVLRSVCVFGGT